MSYASEVLADSPKVWYRLQESSGDPQDSSGNAAHMTAANGTPTYLQPGPILSDPTSKAILLNSATPDYFAMFPAHAITAIGDVGSVAIWLKRADSSTGEMEIFNRDQGFYLGLINNRLFIAKTSVAGIAQSTLQITDTTTWHYCVNTKNGATVHQYIDGVDVTGTVTNATWTNAGGVGVGLGSNGGADNYNGLIAEPALYGTELPAARVLAQYQAAFAEKQSFYKPRRKIVFSGNMR